MKKYKEEWLKRIKEAAFELLKEKGLAPEEGVELDIVPETPPKPEMGDIAFPFFKCSRYFKMAPPQIAGEVAVKLKDRDGLKEARVAGPYLNLFLEQSVLGAAILEDIRQGGEDYGSTSARQGERITIEFSSPNTNKPLHLGHMRNDSIGESVSRILKANGCQVTKVNLINDRGVHICKSMLAYKKFGEGKHPEDLPKKSDHFVGDFYVKFANWAKEDDTAEEQAREMLQKWEAGDPEIVELWKLMNKWAIDGIKKTYEDTGISFDTFYFESQTYLTGKDEVSKGLEKGIFYKQEDNSLWVDLEEYKLDKKLLLRGDGTSVYITQDIGTIIQRHRDCPFDSHIYVVGSEQIYHFQVLFKVLELLGMEWAKNLRHLSYGMVNLPHGKMKSREGTVVDADNLLEELVELAEEVIRKGDHDIEDIPGTASKVALGALNYFLLGTSPTKDMVFNPEESISFTGNTGPYLQYMGARIASILRKFEARKEEFARGQFDPALLDTEMEWGLLKELAAFPDVVEEAGRDLNPSVIAVYLYELAKEFARYYHDIPVLRNENPSQVISRIELIRGIQQVFKKGLFLLGIPYLEKM